jgi:DNA-binding transcriptional LysR family regulator
VVAAAPTYLAVRGTPATPEDLLGHACLTYRWQEIGATHRWRFVRGAGEVEIPVSGPFRGNDCDALVTAALAGLRLIYLV